MAKWKEVRNTGSWIQHSPIGVISGESSFPVTQSRTFIHSFPFPNENGQLIADFIGLRFDPHQWIDGRGGARPRGGFRTASCVAVTSNNINELTNLS